MIGELLSSPSLLPFLGGCLVGTLLGVVLTSVYVLSQIFRP